MAAVIWPQQLQRNLDLAFHYKIVIVESEAFRLLRSQKVEVLKRPDILDITPLTHNDMFAYRYWESLKR